MTKQKMKKVGALASSSIRFLSSIPEGVQKKLNAQQIAAMCVAFAAVESEAYKSGISQQPANESFFARIKAKRIPRMTAVAAAVIATVKGGFS